MLQHWNWKDSTIADYSIQPYIFPCFEYGSAVPFNSYQCTTNKCVQIIYVFAWKDCHDKAEHVKQRVGNIVIFHVLLSFLLALNLWIFACEYISTDNKKNVFQLHAFRRGNAIICIVIIRNSKLEMLIIRNKSFLVKKKIIKSRMFNSLFQFLISFLTMSRNSWKF